MRDYAHEEWLAWQDVVTELAALGIPTDKLNKEGTKLVDLLKLWAFKQERLMGSVQPVSQ